MHERDVNVDRRDDDLDDILSGNSRGIQSIDNTLDAGKRAILQQDPCISNSNYWNQDARAKKRLRTKASIKNLACKHALETLFQL